VDNVAAPRGASSKANRRRRGRSAEVDLEARFVFVLWRRLGVARGRLGGSGAVVALAAVAGGLGLVGLVGRGRIVGLVGRGGPVGFVAPGAERWLVVGRLVPAPGDPTPGNEPVECGIDVADGLRVGIGADR